MEKNIYKKEDFTKEYVEVKYFCTKSSDQETCNNESCIAKPICYYYLQAQKQAYSNVITEPEKNKERK